MIPGKFTRLTVLPTGRFAAGAPDISVESSGFNRMSWIKPNFLWMMYRSGEEG